MPADTDEGDLRVADEIVIRRHELVERFDPSAVRGSTPARPAPGWSCHSTSGRAPQSLPEIKRRALERLADRFTDGVVTVTSCRYRRNGATGGLPAPGW